MSVFTQEVASIILPVKQSGKFTSGNDLNSSIRKREQLIKYGNHMCNWIFTTTGVDKGAIPKKTRQQKMRYGSSTFEQSTKRSNLSIDNDSFDELGSQHSSLDRVTQSKRDSFLTGMSTKRRGPTIKVVQSDFRETDAFKTLQPIPNLSNPGRKGLRQKVEQWQ